MPRRLPQFALLIVAIFGVLDVATLLAPVALALLAIMLYPCVLILMPWLHRTRPPVWIVRGSLVLTGIGAAIWLMSCLIVIRYSPTSNTAWVFGHAEISHEVYTTYNRSPFFPNAPDFELALRPALIPIGCSYIGMGHGKGHSDRTVASPTWPMAFCPLATALVLRALRRERIPAGLCQRCGYDLTGNVSGRCPECGTGVPQTTVTVESPNKT